MSKILVMYFITVIGGLFYVSQFPEKMFPGISLHTLVITRQIKQQWTKWLADPIFAGSTSFFFFLHTGKVNYIGSSHQWWHLMVLASFAYAHYMGEVVFLYWKTHACDSALPLGDPSLVALDASQSGTPHPISLHHY